MENLIITVITTALGYVIGWKRNKTEIEGTQLDNLEKSIKIYQTIIQDLSNKVQDLSNQVINLEIRIDNLMKENKQLKNRIK